MFKDNVFSSYKSHPLPSNPSQFLDRSIMAKILLLFLTFSLCFPAFQAGKHDLVRASCVHASFPGICLRTLQSYGGAGAGAGARTPRDLALLAVRVSLARAHRAAVVLSHLKARGRRQRGALGDCVEQLGDSVEELGRTLAALKHLHRGGDFRWQMSNVQTWVSAALTNEDTCLDGFKEVGGHIRYDVRRRITNVARVTSNALYFINCLDDETPSK